jgi:hypothetical protein
MTRDLESQLHTVQAQYTELMDDHIAAYNRAAPALGLPILK